MFDNTNAKGASVPGLTIRGLSFGGPDVATSCLVATTADFEITSGREINGASCLPLER